MQDLTVGIEVEARSEPIAVPPSLVKQEPCWGYFRDGLAHPDFNRQVFAKSALTELTLEVAESTSPARAGHAKIEFITPRDRTQNYDDFKKSTEDILFILHLLYYFVAAPARARTPRTLIGFLAWYEQYLRVHRVPAEEHPPLVPELVAYNATLDFPANPTNIPLVPRFAPQLTFSGPLERVPALFNAAPGTFSEPLRNLQTPYTPSMLESRAAALGGKFVKDVLRPQRDAQKLHGFFALVFYHLLHYAWRDKINQSDSRSVHGIHKDDFRFLLKSDLQKLREHGLSSADKFAIKAAFFKEALLIEAIRGACRDEIQTDSVFGDRATNLEWRSKTLRRLDKDPVTQWLKAIFINGKNYPKALAELEDTYRILYQEESEVPRKKGVHLARPLMEYRRLVDEQEKYFRTAADVATAIEDLYNKLRFLESNVNPTKALIPETDSRAYYQRLPKLTPTADEVNGLPKLSLVRPQGDNEVENWWRGKTARS